MEVEANLELAYLLFTLRAVVAAILHMRTRLGSITSP